MKRRINLHQNAYGSFVRRISRAIFTQRQIQSHKGSSLCGQIRTHLQLPFAHTSSSPSGSQGCRRIAEDIICFSMTKHVTTSRTRGRGISSISTRYVLLDDVSFTHTCTATSCRLLIAPAALLRIVCGGISGFRRFSEAAAKCAYDVVRCPL